MFVTWPLFWICDFGPVINRLIIYKRKFQPIYSLSFILQPPSGIWKFSTQVNSGKWFFLGYMATEEASWNKDFKSRKWKRIKKRKETKSVTSLNTAFHLENTERVGPKELRRERNLAPYPQQIIILWSVEGFPLTQWKLHFSSTTQNLPLNYIH